MILCKTYHRPSAVALWTVLQLIILVNCELSENKQISLKISGKSKLIGTVEQTIGKNVREFYSFRGIPYAESPVGENRWMDPKLLELTESEYDATEFGEQCVQWFGQMIGSEDCLFLNVYTPRLPEKSNKKDLLPVMVYIHGGGYTIGSSNGIGPKFFMNRDIVLVTFNYRLGVFGYLSTDNKNLPGNYGALDQVVALDWVQKYIREFGGDPGSVTIFGHSAGGGAVHMLTMSPRALGKYHKAIIQSGSGLAHWATIDNPAPYALEFASLLGCTQKVSSRELINCLNKKSTAELLKAQQDSVDFWIAPLLVSHVSDKDTRGDKAFLPDGPKTIMDKGLYHATPIMTGITVHEGIMPYAFFHLAVGKQLFNDKNKFRTEVIPKLIKSILQFDELEHMPQISLAVLEQYFPEGSKMDEASKIQKLIEIYGDIFFNSPQHQMLQKYSEKNINKVYSYVFSHRSPKSPYSIWNQVKELRDEGIDHEFYDSSVGHIDDMFYMFYPCNLFPSDPTHKMSTEDLEFVDRLTKIFVAFAKNGNPAAGIDTAGGFHPWKPIQSGSLNYYNLTSIPAPMGSEFRKVESMFWREIFNNMDDENKKRNIDEL